MEQVRAPKPYEVGKSKRLSWLKERGQDPMQPHSDSETTGVQGGLYPIMKALELYDRYAYQPFRNAMPYTAGYDEALNERIPAYEQEGFNDWESGSKVKGATKIASGLAAETAMRFLDPTDPLQLLGMGALANSSRAAKALRAPGQAVKASANASKAAKEAELLARYQAAQGSKHLPYTEDLASARAGAATSAKQEAKAAVRGGKRGSLSFEKSPGSGLLLPKVTIDRPQIYHPNPDMPGRTVGAISETAHRGEHYGATKKDPTELIGGMDRYNDWNRPYEPINYIDDSDVRDVLGGDINKMVINGKHRLDLAEYIGAKAVPGKQYHVVLDPTNPKKPQIEVQGQHMPLESQQFMVDQGIKGNDLVVDQDRFTPDLAHDLGAKMQAFADSRRPFVETIMGVTEGGRKASNGPMLGLTGGNELDFTHKATRLRTEGLAYGAKDTPASIAEAVASHSKDPQLVWLAEFVQKNPDAYSIIPPVKETRVDDLGDLIVDRRVQPPTARFDNMKAVDLALRTQLRDLGYKPRYQEVYDVKAGRYAFKPTY